MELSEAQKAEERAQFARLRMSEGSQWLMRRAFRRFNEGLGAAQAATNERQSREEVIVEKTEEEIAKELHTKSQELAEKAKSYALRYNVTYAEALKAIGPKEKAPAPAPGLTRAEKEEVYRTAEVIQKKKRCSMLQALIEAWPRDRSMGPGPDDPDCAVLIRAQKLSEEQGLALGAALDAAEKQIGAERAAKLARERK